MICVNSKVVRGGLLRDFGTHRAAYWLKRMGLYIFAALGSCLAAVLEEITNRVLSLFNDAISVGGARDNVRTLSRPEPRSKCFHVQTRVSTAHTIVCSKDDYTSPVQRGQSADDDLSDVDSHSASLLRAAAWHSLGPICNLRDAHRVTRTRQTLVTSLAGAFPSHDHRQL